MKKNSGAERVRQNSEYFAVIFVLFGLIFPRLRTRSNLLMHWVGSGRTHTLKAISLVPSRSLQRMLVCAHKLVVMKLMVNTFFQSYIFMQKSFFIGGGGSGGGVVVGVAFGIHWKPNILFICYFNSFKMGGFTLCFFHGINISWFYDCFGIAHIHELTLNRVPNRKKVCSWDEILVHHTWVLLQIFCSVSKSKKSIE